MSAAITIGFSDREDGDTTLFVTQFVALEKPKPGAADLYTMIVRTYSDDATSEDEASTLEESIFRASPSLSLV